MRRNLLVLAVMALVVASVSLFAAAQSRSQAPSAASADHAAGSYAQARTSPAAIRSDKTVSIVASGIAPRALALDSSANVYLTNAVAPNRVFTLTGLPSLSSGADAALQSARLAAIAGNGETGSLGDGGSALGAQFNLKTDSLFLRSGLAIAADGTIFVADTLNSTIRRIAGSDSSEPGVTRSIAGRWAAQQTVKFVEPLGLALDRSGNLYVADHNTGAIDVLPNAISSAPGEQQVRILAHVAGPAAIALTTDGRELFVASVDTGAVLKIDTQTREIQPIAAFPARKDDARADLPAICAPVAQSAAEQPAAQSAVCPAGVAVDGAGNLFIADANSGKLLRVDAKTSALTTVASGLLSPGAMRFDNNGNLYVAEQGANRIVKFVSMGAVAGNLTITSPAPLPAPPSPRVCPQTAPFNFCDQPLGGSTATQAFTVTNNTSTSVTGLTISFTGSNPSDFQALSNTCGTSLGPGASCTINVDFAPTAAGARAANLGVADSAGDSASATVSGTGDDFQIALNGSQEEQAVVQGGTLTYNFNIEPDAVFGGVVTITCPSNLPSYTTCTPSAGTVTVTPGTAAPFSVTFKTTYNGVTGGYPGSGSVPVLILPSNRTGPPLSLLPTAFAVLLIALAIFLVAAGRRLRRLPATDRTLRILPARAISMAALLLAVAAFSVLAGCKSHPVPADLNTPAGSTTMMIQGSAQNAGRGVTIILDVTGRG